MSVVAGSVSSVVAVLAGLVSMPMFLRLLGSEAFGLLGFVLTLQAALLVLDGGVALSMTRAVAQIRDDASRSHTAGLLHGLARVNWCVAAFVVIAIALLAPVLAGTWLNLVALPLSYVAQSLAMAALVIGARWPLALYQGILMGSHNQKRLAVINVSMTLLSTGGSVASLILLSPDLRILFGWMAVAALGHALWCRHAALGVLGRGARPARGQVLLFYRESAALGWLGLVGLLLMQVDKVVLSKIVAVDTFGYYIIASMVAGALYAMVAPVFHALYPRFSALAAECDLVSLQSLYRTSSLVLATLVFPVAAAIAFFSYSVLLLWTRDAGAAAAAAPIVTLLTLGTALHSIMFIPYALKLACGASRLALAISVSLLAVFLPVAVFAALRWGATGAAASWLALHLLYVVLGSHLTHRRLLPGVGFHWLARDIAPCALLSLCIAYVGSWLARSNAWNATQSGLGAMAVTAVCWLLMLCTSTRLRSVVGVVLTRNAEELI